MEKLRINGISGLLFVDIELWSDADNTYRDMSILLDTGASVTTISDFILTGIGYGSYGKTINVTTASGTISVQTKTIRKIRIGSVEIDDVEVYAHDFPEECFSDGVLGMNVLGLFNFKVDMDRNILELELRNAPAL